MVGTPAREVDDSRTWLPFEDGCAATGKDEQAPTKSVSREHEDPKGTNDTSVPRTSKQEMNELRMEGR